MKKQMKDFRSWGLLLVVLAFSSPLWAREQPASNMDILRDKIKADKKLLIAENLMLTESEATQFWPVYEEYQKELQAINQKLTKTIEGYAAEYNAATLRSLAEPVCGEAFVDYDSRDNMFNGVLPALPCFPKSCGSIRRSEQGRSGHRHGQFWRFGYR